MKRLLTVDPSRAGAHLGFVSLCSSPPYASAENVHYFALGTTLTTHALSAAQLYPSRVTEHLPYGSNLLIRRQRVLLCTVKES